MTEEQIEQAAKVMFECGWAFWSKAIDDFHNRELFNDLHKPQIGDYVFENTNPFLPYRKLVGKLVEMPSNSEYILEMIDGQTMHWQNAKMIKIADENTRKLLR